MTRISIPFLLAVILALFPRSVSAEEVTIGWIGALSGDSAAIGSDSLAALKSAVNDANAATNSKGITFSLLVEDDGYDVARALTAYEKLKSSVSSRFIFVSTYGAVFALAKRAEKDQVVLIDTLDCNDELIRAGESLLCLASRTESIADNFISAIKENGGGKVAVLYEEEAWFNFIVRGLSDALGNDLVQVAAPTKSGDYRSELVRVKNSGAKHLVLLGNDAMGLAVKQASDAGLKLKLYSIASITSPGFMALAGPSLEGATVSHWEAPRSEGFEAFLTSFVRDNKRSPFFEFVAAPTYDAGRIVTDSFREAMVSMNRRDLRGMIISRPPYSGSSGVIRFDRDGAVRSIRERLFTFRAGKLEPLALP